jgi:hypothetical protein
VLTKSLLSTHVQIGIQCNETYSAMSGRVTSGRTTPIFDREVSMVKVSVFYPNRPGSHFDMSYYCSKHIPMVQRLLGSTRKSVAVEEGIAGRFAASDREKRGEGSRRPLRSWASRTTAGSAGAMGHSSSGGKRRRNAWWQSCTQLKQNCAAACS